MRGEDYEDLYDDDNGKENSSDEVDDYDEDELEDGFMKGYEKENSPRCANCKEFVDEDKCIEEDFSGFSYSFCSQECLKEFEKKHK